MENEVPAIKAARIKRVYVADILCDSIKENIISGTWKAGEKLPTEHELASLYGLNRMTVRAALQKLNTLGVLETRVGDGTYVRDFDFARLMDTVSDFYVTPQLLRDVSEFRKAVEIPCAMLAIDNASNGEIAELKAIMDNLMVVFSHAWERYDAGDLDKSKEIMMDMSSIDLTFHEQICKMSHNKLLYYSFLMGRESIYQFMLNVGQQRVAKWKRINEAESMTAHKRIYEAIKGRDKEKCAELLDKMYNDAQIDSL